MKIYKFGPGLGALPKVIIDTEGFDFQIDQVDVAIYLYPKTPQGLVDLDGYRYSLNLSLIELDKFLVDLIEYKVKVEARAG
jgi:hypothetical protein|tara:strand:+ start:552 stop:794 length:243 start_codon:yes stop_codon:yes gene_type:complete